MVAIVRTIQYLHYLSQFYNKIFMTLSAMVTLYPFMLHNFLFLCIRMWQAEYFTALIHVTHQEGCTVKRSPVLQFPAIEIEAPALQKNVFYLIIWYYYSVEVVAEISNMYNIYVLYTYVLHTSHMYYICNILVWNLSYVQPPHYSITCNIHSCMFFCSADSSASVSCGETLMVKQSYN